MERWASNWGWMGLGLAAAPLLAWLCAPLTPASAQPLAATTIAVLPLANASGDAAQNFFAEAMTDEIATALAGLRGLNVVGRSSVFQAAAARLPAKALGEALHAPYLVRGAAGLAAGRVHVTVSVMRAGDGTVVSSHDEEAAVADIFALEERVARWIAAALQVPDGEREIFVRNRTSDSDAYLDFLRAKVAARARGAAALAEAVALLEPVVARAPDFAPAAAMLAYDYALTPLFAPSLRGGMPDEERKIVARTIPLSDALAHRATTLDPNGAEGFVALGYAHLVQRRFAAAEDAFRQVLALNPNQADGLHGLSQLLAAMGRIKESLAMREHLQAGEPFIVNYTADTAEIVWLDGDTPTALAMLEPFRPGRTLELALIEAAAGQYRQAAAAVREMPAGAYPPGMTEAAAKILDAAPAPAADAAAMPRLGNLSFAFMHVGAPERVLEFYEDEISAGYFQPISTTWFWHPSYAAVRRTDRFKKLAVDLGLVDYWRLRGWPAQCHPVGEAALACD
jgi:adenylate cyclase